MDPLLVEGEIPLSSLAIAPPKSPLGGSFFGNPSLLILPNLFSSNTPIPFL
jgi:hypothetical protein